MIAAALRVDIERLAGDVRSSPLLARAAGGTLRAEHLAAYLASVHRLVQQTPVHLAEARRRAEAAGDRRLAAHFEAKLGEEHGHDAWAERDLHRVGRMRRSMATSATVAPSMMSLVDYVGTLVQRAPVLYLAYILVAEYVTVLLGPEWLHQLEARCGIPRSAMTVVGNHAELDQAHTQEAFDHIDELVGDPRLLPQLRAVVVESLRLFNAFCSEVVTIVDAELARDAHAPAA